MLTTYEAEPLDPATQSTFLAYGGVELAIHDFGLDHTHPFPGCICQFDYGGVCHWQCGLGCLPDVEVSQLLSLDDSTVRSVTLCASNHSYFCELTLEA